MIAEAACAANTVPMVSASVSHTPGRKLNRLSAPAVRSAVYSLNERLLSTPCSTAAGAYRGQRGSSRRSSLRTIVCFSAASWQGPSSKSCCSLSSFATRLSVSATDSNSSPPFISNTPARSAAGISSTAAVVTSTRTWSSERGAAISRASSAMRVASSCREVASKDSMEPDSPRCATRRHPRGLLRRLDRRRCRKLLWREFGAKGPGYPASTPRSRPPGGPSVCAQQRSSIRSAASTSIQRNFGKTLAR